MKQLNQYILEGKTNPFYDPEDGRISSDVISISLDDLSDDIESVLRRIIYKYTIHNNEEITEKEFDKAIQQFKEKIFADDKCCIIAYESNDSWKFNVEKIASIDNSKVKFYDYEKHIHEVDIISNNDNIYFAKGDVDYYSPRTVYVINRKSFLKNAKTIVETHKLTLDGKKLKIYKWGNYSYLEMVNDIIYDLYYYS